MDLDAYSWLRSRLEGDEGRSQIEIVRRLTPIAEELGCSMAQLAIAWCLKNKHVSTVITGASKPEQVVQNMQALEVVPLLNQEVMGRIESLLNNKPAPPQQFR
jgi:aryl-alcohol dehydrogenase-like predicted oxidoreductase